MIDFHQIAEDLKAKGVSYYAQSQALDVEWSTFRRWLDKTIPKHQHGEAWLVLHEQVCGSELTAQRRNKSPILVQMR